MGSLVVLFHPTHFDVSLPSTTCLRHTQEGLLTELATHQVDSPAGQQLPLCSCTNKSAEGLSMQVGP